MTFSCAGCHAFMEKLKAAGRKQVLLTGIETHVCIYQTASDLLRQGFEVGVIADAVSSRCARNKEIGLDRMVSEGAVIISTEMILFEMLKTAEGELFKKVLSSLK